MLDHIYGLAYIKPMNLPPDSFLRALADETRLRCLALLFSEGELCVCELTYALSLSQPKVSRHLASLREAEIVSDRRAGLWIYYRMHPGLPPWALAILQTTITGINDRQPYREDRAALAGMPNRPGSRCCA